MNRRQALLSLSAAATAIAARPLPVSLPWLPAGQRLAPVRVDASREIRTVVGLRPFRSGGYRVEAELLDDKLLIHNYGHGGAGVTLSWGTAHLAVEHALATEHRNAAVLGCGAVGLATAILLQRRGWHVTIRTRDLPPRTTSNVAGALWDPYLVADDEHASDAFKASFESVCRIAHRYFQELPAHRFGIRWMPIYIPADDAPEGPPAEIADLFPDTRELSPDEHPFSASRALKMTTLMIEPPIYMDELLREFRAGGGSIVVGELASLRQIAELEEPVVVNCTGLGSARLVGDEQMTPVKGQLTVLLPQPEVDYGVISEALYMFPRQDGILLGGTAQRGDWSLEPDAAAKDRILSGHRQLFRFRPAE